MKLFELHQKFQSNNIPDSKYYLHGLYGSTDDNDKFGLTIKKGKYGLEYEVYYRERGEKHSSMVFTNEDEAYDYIFKKVYEDWSYDQIGRIEGLEGMTVNERLFTSGLMNEFDRCKKTNKSRAAEILRWLRVDELSIKKIL
jgi:hypothetical protein